MSTDLALPRTLYAGATPYQLQPILQGLFVTEVLSPGDTCWLVTSRVWNVPVIDNGANAFRHLEPTWAQGPIWLLQVLHKLMHSGTTVYVLTQQHRDNAAFLAALQADAAPERLKVQTRRTWEMETEGIATSSMGLEGPLTFTQTGLLIPRGEVVVHAEAEALAHLHSILDTAWKQA